jgi:enamine deaminase RidA (YjgF/YER057c/UK114 family)
MKNTVLFLFTLVVMLIAQMASLYAQTRSVEIKRINPPTLYETSAYTQVTTVSAGMKLVMVAGQVGRELNPQGPNREENSKACPHPDMRGQYIVTMENVGKALAAGGATWDDVVRIRKFTTDMGAYLEVSHDLPVYWSPDKPPSSTLIEVAGLADPCFLVEIDVTAVVEPD